MNQSIFSLVLILSVAINTIYTCNTKSRDFHGPKDHKTTPTLPKYNMTAIYALLAPDQIHTPDQYAFNVSCLGCPLVP
jgi:hypothetical protein